jgi:hypothetical protein
MTTYNKTAIAVGAVVALAGGLWLYTRYEIVKAAAIENQKTATAVFIQTRAAALIKPENFSAGDPAAQRKVFEAFFDAVQSPNLVRMKVWNRNFTVVWSNLAELIGQRFPDNHEVEESFEGKIEFEIEKPKAENILERQYQELSELYVPISNAQGETVGVVEVYQPTFSLYQEINAGFRRRLVPALVVCLAAYLLILFVLGRFIKPRQSRE